MIFIDAIERFAEQYDRSKYEKLIVRAVMAPGSFVFKRDPINLDSVISKMIIFSLGYVTLPDSDEPYSLPLPIGVSWRDDNGCPLYESSSMITYGKTQQGSVYLHKRPTQAAYTKNKKIKANVGRWMARRDPQPVIYFGPNSGLRFYVHGQRSIIGELLNGITKLGKHRARGFGDVLRWEVEQHDFISFYHDDGVLIKPMPVESGLARGLNRPTLIGWTPPYWKPALFRYGWRPGTQISNIDFFDSIDGMEQ